MKISVVIPHLNQEKYLTECLRSIVSGERPADEIIVVDNGSIVLPKEICNLFPNVVLLVEPTPGPGPARNMGVANCTGDVVAFIDADCRAHYGWLSAVSARIGESSSGILGGDVRIDPVSKHGLTMLEAYESVYSFRMDLYIKNKGFSGTGNLAVRRTVLETVGPFSGIDVAEDKDWGNRALALGYRTDFVTEMLVFHPARKSFSELFRKWDRQIAHEFTEARKIRFGKLRWMIKLLLLTPSILIEVPHILRSDRVEGIGNRTKTLLSISVVRVYRTWLMLRYILRVNSKDVSQIWNRP